MTKRYWLRGGLTALIASILVSVFLLFLSPYFLYFIILPAGVALSPFFTNIDDFFLMYGSSSQPLIYAILFSFLVYFIIGSIYGEIYKRTGFRVRHVIAIIFVVVSPLVVTVCRTLFGYKSYISGGLNYDYYPFPVKVTSCWGPKWANKVCAHPYVWWGIIASVIFWVVILAIAYKIGKGKKVKL